MKSFKKFVAEVAQPKPEEEKRFKDMHSYETVPHPVAEPHQHTGEIVAKAPAKRKADQEGDANYDKAVKNPEKRMANESVEEEQLDEISKELASRYLKKSVAKAAHAGDQIATAHDAYDKEGEKKRRKKGIRNFLNTQKGVERATNRLTKKEAVETDEELSPKQKKIDKNKNGKIDGHDLAMLRAKKKNEEVEVTETTSSALKKPVTMTGPDGKTRTVMKKAKADRTDDRGQDSIGTNESAEMIDEAVKLKRGPMRLKDGSQVMVSKEDADLLNRMFSDLSANNQRQMQKVMMMDKAGYEEIRGFAREAL